MLDERKAQLLGLVVESYIETMEPIGSRFLTETGEVEVSGATIRNELRALEEEGYLTHPHTSAGRIPTEYGYRYYVSHIMKPEALSKKMTDQLQEIKTSAENAHEAMKGVGKFLTQLSGNAVIIAFGKDHMYYTGMSALFAQPEFQDYSRTVQVSSVFDHCEERLGSITELVGSDVRVLIGQENPLGAACSVIVSPVQENTLMMLLGPMRMPYKHNVAAMQTLQTIFS